jgi:hypothetical protein
MPGNPLEIQESQKETAQDNPGLLFLRKVPDASPHDAGTIDVCQ